MTGVHLVTGIAVIALWCIWIDPTQREKLYLASALAIAIYAAFFATALARPVYGGSLYDENGYQPFPAPIGPKTWRWDVNVTAFTILSAVLLIGCALIPLGV